MKNEPDKTEKQLLAEISRKLDTLAALSAIHGKSKEDQIKIMDALGLSNTEMSNLTAMPKGTVDVIRAKNKKKGKKNG